MNIIDTGLSFRNMDWGNTPREKIVHHIEAEGPTWTVEQIHRMHKDDNGWAGIAYHYYIRIDGSIYKGRPDDAIGAHVAGHNTNTLGIAFEGNYDSRQTMPDAQYNAWCELSAYLDSKYGVMPTYGHREVGSSECPGRYFPLDKVKAAQSIQGLKPLPLKMSESAMSYSTEICTYRKGDNLTAIGETPYSYILQLSSGDVFVQKTDVEVIEQETKDRYKRTRIKVIKDLTRCWKQETKPFLKSECITAHDQCTDYYRLDIDGISAWVRMDCTENR